MDRRGFLRRVAAVAVGTGAMLGSGCAATDKGKALVDETVTETVTYTVEADVYPTSSTVHPPTRVEARFGSDYQPTYVRRISDGRTWTLGNFNPVTGDSELKPLVHPGQDYYEEVAKRLARDRALRYFGLPT